MPLKESQAVVQPKFTLEHRAENVSLVKIEVNSWSELDHSFLLRTDAHQDNPDCNREMEERHLNEAVSLGAGIIDNGDLFCAMQGKYDKRSDKSKCRPEHQVSDYLDALVETAADRYEPYGPWWIQFGQGNHETSIQDRHETSLTARLVKELRDRNCTNAIDGWYSGWVVFQFTRQTEVRSIALWRNHGYGGGGPVTLNTIQAANRMPMMISGANIIHTGHVHESWVAEKVQVELDRQFKPKHRTLWIVQGTTYKDEYKGGKGGFHVRTGKPPKPLGAWWLHFRHERGDIRPSFRRAD
jgi:hypothetical protein